MMKEDRKRKEKIENKDNNEKQIRKLSEDELDKVAGGRDGYSEEGHSICLYLM